MDNGGPSLGRAWVLREPDVTLKPTKLFEFAAGSFKMAPALRPALMLLVSGCVAFIAAPAAPLCRARARASGSTARASAAAADSDARERGGG